MSASSREDSIKTLYEQAKPNLWQRLFHWRRFRMKRLSESRFLSAARQRYPSDIPDCESCSDSCCQSPSLVSLRLVDIARLMDAGLESGIANVDFSARRTIYSKYPQLELAESKDSFRLFPVLRQKEDGTCFFLSNSKRCDIYEHRPLACRAFPYLLSEDLKSIHFARGGCSNGVAADDSSLVQKLVGSVVEHFNSKVSDLIAIEESSAEIERIGLGEYLRGSQFRSGGNESSGFSALMHTKQSHDITGES